MIIKSKIKQKLELTLLLKTFLKKRVNIFSKPTRRDFVNFGPSNVLKYKTYYKKLKLLLGELENHCNNTDSLAILSERDDLNTDLVASPESQDWSDFSTLKNSHQLRDTTNDKVFSKFK